MMMSGVIFAICVLVVVRLLQPRVAVWLRSQAWEFSDRMRWYGVRLDAKKVMRWLVSGSIISAVAVWLLLGNLLLSGAVAVLVILSPGWTLAAMQSHRRSRFGSQFVDVLLLLSNSLRAGFNLNQALQIVAHEMPSPAKNEFALVLMDRELGASMEKALENLGDRMQSDSVMIFITAILVTMQTGGDIARMLDKLVNTIRDRERVEDRVKTMTASGRMQGYLVAALPVLMFVGVSVFSPETVRQILSNWIGLLVILAGVVFNVVGLLVIRKMSAVKV